MKRFIAVLLTLLALVPAAASAATTRVPSFYEGLTITSTSITSSVPILFPDGTAGAPSSAFASDADGTGTGLFRQAANSIGYSLNGGEVFRMSTSGMFVLSDLIGFRAGAAGDAWFARRSAATPAVNIGAAAFSAATNSVAVGGVFCVNTTSTATTGTTEEVLATCTLPANALSANGKGVRISATATTAANGNTKVYRIRFGGIAGGQLVAPTITTSGAGVAAIAYVIRTGSGAQYGWGSATTGTDGATGNASMNDVVLGVTDTGTIDIVVTGTTATAAGDLTHKAVIVEFFN